MRCVQLAALLLAACGGEGVRADAGGDDGPVDPLASLPDIDTDLSHYPDNVWVTGSLFKVQPDTPPPDRRRIYARVIAARNEVESFQVHVRADVAPIALTVTAADLVDPVSGTRIVAADQVVVFREEYLDITTPSDIHGMTGRVPDALIPAVDPWHGEARNAFPVTVPVGENRSAWIDVHVPPDVPSGWYVGGVTLSDGDTPLTTLPVQLGVWDFDLPSTSTLTTAFGLDPTGLCVQAYGSQAACGAYPGAGGDPERGVQLTSAAMATAFLDYRISLAGAAHGMPTDGDWTAFDAVYDPLMEGTADTRFAGARLTHLWYPGDVGDSALLANWADHFRDRGWLDRTSVLVCHEPPAGCTWDQARSRADAIRAAAPDLPTLVTTDIERATADGLLDRVDILAPAISDIEARYLPNQRWTYYSWLTDPSHHLWWYQSCIQRESCVNGTVGGATDLWPSYAVDAAPVRNRVIAWMAFAYDIEGETYHSANHCWTATCGDGTTDPWVSQYAFGGNGDGTLFYPGIPARIGGTTPVPVPSIRLALIRDAMEDYEYLNRLVSLNAEFHTDLLVGSFVYATYFYKSHPESLLSARGMTGQLLHMVHPE